MYDLYDLCWGESKFSIFRVWGHCGMQTPSFECCSMKECEQVSIASEHCCIHPWYFDGSDKMLTVVVSLSIWLVWLLKNVGGSSVWKHYVGPLPPAHMLYIWTSIRTRNQGAPILRTVSILCVILIKGWVWRDSWWDGGGDDWDPGESRRHDGGDQNQGGEYQFHRSIYIFVSVNVIIRWFVLSFDIGMQYIHNWLSRSFWGNLEGSLSRRWVRWRACSRCSPGWSWRRWVFRWWDDDGDGDGDEVRECHGKMDHWCLER